MKHAKPVRMLLIIAVLALLSAAFLLFRYAMRRHTKLPTPDPTYPLEPPSNARPLFEPTEEDLRRELAEREAKTIASREYRSRAKAREEIDNALNAWRAERNALAAGELLRSTAKFSLEGSFYRAAKEILDDFHASRTVRLDAGDLAALLDSHVRLLPAEIRSSGELFWLKREIADLRERAS